MVLLDLNKTQCVAEQRDTTQRSKNLAEFTLVSSDVEE